MGCDPIAGMTAIAMDEKQDIGLRAQMFKELAQYVAPKRKAIEMSGADGNELTLADLVNGSYELERRKRAAGELIDLQPIASH